MTRRLVMHLVAVAGTLLSTSPPFRAADLAKVDRTIAKQPKYLGTPKYGLVVLGASAEHRLWLVHDGDTLYVDRNGNGDLTEEGEKLSARKGGSPAKGYEFWLKELKVADKLHQDFLVSTSPPEIFGPQVRTHPVTKRILETDPTASIYALQMAIERAGVRGDNSGGRVTQLAGPTDRNGALVFALSPKDAPVMRFDGPWQLSFESSPALRIGRDNEITLNVGSRGVGAGTFTPITLDAIPDGVHPKVTIRFGSAKKGEPPISRTFELTHRC